MAEREQFSVCMSVYHRDDPVWLQQAVESILQQTRLPAQIVLVVDGPVGAELEQVICRYEAAERFLVIRLAENQGLGNARRVGLAHCSHDLVAMMDSDDLSLPDRFEKQLAVFAAEPELSIVGGQIAEFMETPEQVVGIRSVPCRDGQIRSELKVRCPFNHVTVMVRKSHVDAAGGYLDWFSNEDYYLWIRMYLSGCRFANVDQVLVNVRVGSDMYRRRGGWKYFRSELGIQNYMLQHKVIGLGSYCVNVAKRLIVQVLLPNRIRGWVFRKFARTQAEMETKHERTEC